MSSHQAEMVQHRSTKKSGFYIPTRWKITVRKYYATPAKLPILSTIVLGTIYWPSFSQYPDIFMVIAIVCISFFGSFIVEIICSCFVIVNLQKHKYWVILTKYLVLFGIVLSVICILFNGLLHELIKISVKIS